MNTKLLQCFVVVYEKNSFTGASEELHTVQSNVSARIGDLEEFVGEPLFVRQHRKIVPTETGHLLYAHAKEILASIDRVTRLVKQQAAG